VICQQKLTREIKENNLMGCCDIAKKYNAFLKIYLGAVI